MFVNGHMRNMIVPQHKELLVQGHAKDGKEPLNELASIRKREVAHLATWTWSKSLVNNHVVRALMVFPVLRHGETPHQPGLHMYSPRLQAVRRRVTHCFR